MTALVKRLFLLGLDGATWDLISPLIKKDLLPNFKKIRENGVWGILKSPNPPLTPPAWTSISTGLNPGKHNIFSFTKPKKDYKQEIVLSNKKKVKALWDSFEEKKKIVVNWPMTFPAKKINGIMISGMLTPSKKSNFTYPETFKHKIPEDYKIEPENEDNFKDIIDTFDSQKKLIEKLIKSEWDMFFYVVRTTDSLQHFFYNDSKKIETLYRKVDRLLELILNSIDDETLLVLVSDHGFKKVSKQFNIIAWLEREGYLKTKNKNSKNNDFINKVKLILYKLKIKRLVRSIIPKKILNKLLTPSLESVSNEIDYKETKVFPGGWGGVYINTTNYEDGTVSENEKEELIKKLKTELECVIENNVPVLKKVIDTKKTYNGPYTKNAPDLFIVPNTEKEYTTSLDRSNNIIEKTTKEGDHQEDGIFLFYTKKTKNRRIDAINILDIAPTIADFLGKKIKTDGKKVLLK